MKPAVDGLIGAVSCDLPILLEGETGTGKDKTLDVLLELTDYQAIARFDCTGLERRELSEIARLSSADLQRRFGIVAKRSILALEGITSLTLRAQDVLLYCLEKLEVLSDVCSPRGVARQTRLVSMTRDNHRLLARRGDLQPRLHHRIAAFPVRLPPLRERLADIPCLVERWRTLRSQGGNVTPARLFKIAKESAYEWPGNIREFFQVLERAALGDGTFDIESFADATAAYGWGLADAERRHISRALEVTHGVIEGPNGAAALLGVAPSTLRSRMSKFSIRRNRTSR